MVSGDTVTKITVGCYCQKSCAVRRQEGHSFPCHKSPPGVCLLLGGDRPTIPTGSGAWAQELQVSGPVTSGPPVTSAPLQLHLYFSCLESLICQTCLCIPDQDLRPFEKYPRALCTSLICPGPGHTLAPAPPTRGSACPYASALLWALPSCFSPHPPLRPPSL